MLFCFLFFCFFFGLICVYICIGRGAGRLLSFFTLVGCIMRDSGTDEDLVV